MILEAGSVRVHGTAVPYRKQGTEQFHGGTEGPYVRIRPVILGPVLHHPAGDIHTGKILLQGDFQIRICFIVLQHNVIAGTVFFDKVAFQDQRLNLTVCHNGFDIFHMTGECHHFRGMTAGFTEVTVNPVVQVLGLAYVDYPAGHVVHQVHAGLVRQYGQGLFDFVVDKHNETFCCE